MGNAWEAYKQKLQNQQSATENSSSPWVRFKAEKGITATSFTQPTSTPISAITKPTVTAAEVVATPTKTAPVDESSATSEEKKKGFLKTGREYRAKALENTADYYYKKAMEKNANKPSTEVEQQAEPLPEYEAVDVSSKGDTALKVTTAQGENAAKEKKPAFYKASELKGAVRGEVEKNKLFDTGDSEMDAYLEQISGNAGKAVADDRNSWARGALRQSASGFANVLPTVADTIQDVTAASRKWANKRMEGQEKPAHTLAPISTGDSEMDAYLEQISGATAKATERATGVNEGPTGLEEMQQYSDELNLVASSEIEKSKEGKSQVEKALIDTGVGAVQLVGDIALAVATGGETMPVMALRAFGSRAQTARQEGASSISQTVAGLADAGKEVLTEMLFGGNALMKKHFGKGLLDDVSGGLLKHIGSETGQMLWKGITSFGEEGAEELLAAFADPFVSWIYDSEALRKAYGNIEDWKNGDFSALKTTLSNAAYEGMIGGFIGLGGFGVNISNEMKAVQRDVALREIAKTHNLEELGKKMGGAQEVMVKALLESQNYAEDTETRILGRDLNIALQEIIDNGDSAAMRKFFEANRAKFEELVQLMEYEKDSIIPEEQDYRRNGTLERVATQEIDTAEAANETAQQDSPVHVMSDTETRVMEALTAQGVSSEKAADLLEIVTRIADGDTSLSNNEIVNKGLVAKDKQVRAAINQLTGSSLPTTSSQISASAAKTQVREIIERIAAQKAAAVAAEVASAQQDPIVEPIAPVQGEVEQSIDNAEPASEAEIQPSEGSVKSEGYVYDASEVREMGRAENYTETEIESLLDTFGDKAMADGIDPKADLDAFIRYSIDQSNTDGVDVGNITAEQKLTQDIMRVALKDLGIKDIRLVTGDPNMVGVNGSYRDGVVTINADRRNAQTFSGIAWTVGHEIVHAAEDADAGRKENGVTTRNAKIVNDIFDVMRVLADAGAIEGQYAEVAKGGDAFQALIDRKKNAEHSFLVRGGLTMEQAEQRFNDYDAKAEIAADFLGSLLGHNFAHEADGRFGSKYGTVDIFAMMESSKPGIISWIRDKVVRARNSLKGHNGVSTEERKAKAVMQRHLTKLSRYLSEAIEQGTMRSEESESEKNSVLDDSWEKQCDDVMSGEMDRHSAMFISETPNLLAELGIYDLPMTLTQKHFRAAVDGTNSAHPGKISLEDIKNLPQLISQPVAIMGSNTNPTGAIVVVTSARDSLGNPVVVAIRPEGRAEVDAHKGKTNHILTVYGANHLHTPTNSGGMSTLERAASKGEILYINKKRSQDLYQADGLQLPRALGSLDFDTIIRDWNGYVKKEAPKREAKNVFTGNTIKWSVDDGHRDTKIPVSAKTREIMEKLKAGEAVDAETINNLEEVREGREALRKLTAEFIAKHPEFKNVKFDDVGTYLLYDEERENLRAQIIADRIAEGSVRFEVIDDELVEVYNGPVRKDKRIDIVIGLPASGKSSSIVNPMSQYYQSAVVDSDIIKQRLPEYQGGDGASLVHSESSDMNRIVLAGLLDTGTNIVLPIVGSKVSGVEKYISQAQKAGYEVHVHLNELSSSKAIGRMMQRYFNDGRFIDPAHAMAYEDRPTSVYEEISKRSDINGYSRWNNDVEPNERPIQREVSGNNSAYARYSGQWLKRAGEKSAESEGAYEGNSHNARGISRDKSQNIESSRTWGADRGIGNPEDDGVQRGAESALQERGPDNRGRQDSERAVGEPLRAGIGESRESGGRDGRGDLGISLGTLIPENTRKIMTDKGMPDVGLSETTDRGAFSAALDVAKAANRNGGMVDSQSVEALSESGARTFMRPDGGAGVAVEADGNIVGVFKNPEYKARSVVYDLVLTALSNGGTHLDCYSTYSHADLRTKYATLGFKPVAWLEFSREYAPDGWDYEAWGEPDVVLWVHNGESVEQVIQHAEGYHIPTREEIHALPKFDDYDAAKDYQRQEVQKMLRERDRAEALRRVFRNARERYGEGDEFVQRLASETQTEAGRKRLEQVFRPQTEQARAEERTRNDLRMQRERERERERRDRMREAFRFEKQDIRENARVDKLAALAVQEQKLDDKWNAKMEAKIERLKEQAAERLRITKRKADVTRALENETARIREGKAKAEGRRKLEEERANNKALAAERRVLARTSAKEAKQILKKSRDTDRPDYSNSEVDTLRQLPENDVKTSKISELGHKLRTAAKRAYTAMVNQALSIDSFSKKQEAGIKAGSLVNIVFGSAATIETIYQNELVGRDGRHMGDAMKDVMMVWSEDGKTVDQKKQALLQDYMLHLHNIDRMSFTERALKRVENIEAQHPWLVELDAKDFAYFAALTKSETEATGTERRKEIAREYAKALKALNEAKDKPVFADKDGKPVSAETSRKRVAAYEAENDWLKEKAESIYEWWDNFMHEWAVGSTLSAADYADWKELYPHYVPTYRADESSTEPAVKIGGANASINSVFKAAKGSTKPVRNIEESFSMLVSKIVDTSRKNELFRNVVDTALLDEHGVFSDFAVYDWDGWYAQSAGYGEAMELASLLNGENVGEIKESYSKALEELSDGSYRITALNEYGERVSAWVSKEMYRSLAAVTQTSKLLGEGTNTLTRIGSKLTNPMKAMITGYNPNFALRNVMRDIPTAVVNGMSGLAFPKYYARAWKAMAQKADSWKQFQALGGTHFGYYGMSTDWAARMQEKQGVGKKIKNALGAFSEATESTTRFAEYLATIDKLGDTYEARIQGIKNAAEVTVDFSRKGEYGKLANAWIPYWNPAVQGIDKTIRQIFANGTTVEEKFKGAGITLSRAAVVALLPELLQYLILKVFDRDEEWEKLSDRMRDTYFCIPIPGKNKFLKIPKSREWGTLLGTPLMRILEGIDGRSNPFENYIEDALLANFSISGVEDAIGLGTVIDLKTNKDFAGRDIVPYAYQEASKAMQYDSDTTAVSYGAAWVWNKSIAKLAAELGMDIELSPMQLDYIINDYFGDFFSMFVEMAPIGLFDGSVSIKDIGATMLGSMEGTWVGDNRYSNYYVGEYYDILDYLDRGIADEKLMNPGDYKNSYIYKLDKAFNEAYGEQMTELNKEAATLKDGEEKDLIKDQLSELAIEAVDWFRNELVNNSDDPFLRVSYGDFSEELQDALIGLDDYSKTYHFKPSPSSVKVYTDPDNKNREYQLTAEQYEQYKVFYMEAYDEIMTKAVNSRTYLAGDDEERAEYLDEVRDDVHVKAKEKLFKWLSQNGVKSTRKEK